MKTIAITGATGYFGKYLLQKLLSLKKYNLYVLADDITGEINLPSVDVIIHLAAKKPSNIVSIDDLYQTNYEGTKNLARACTPDTHFIFLSSDYVFKSDSEKLYTEHDVKSPETDYGESKSKSEDFLLQNVDKVTILRTSMLYGYINWQRKNFIQFLIENISNNKKIDIYNDIFCRPTHVEDLSEFIVAAIEEGLYGVIHACSDIYIDRYELASLFCDINGLDKECLISCQSPETSYWPKHLNLQPSEIFLKNIEISLKNGLILQQQGQ